MKNELLDHLIAIRRKLHKFPELGYQEFKTSALVCAELEALKIPYKKNIAVTGVVATLKKGEGPCIVLRADMDALPLQEETGLPFSSRVDRVMHACGHDVHTTMLLGACHLLKEKDFNGTIKFVFQPSEEGTSNDPERKSGGEVMMESGELVDASAALALHVQPLLETGKISFALGQAMAANACFQLVVEGKYGHAAFPHLGVDAIVVATHLIQAVQSLVTRYTSPTEPVVISFTQIHGGVAPNVTAEKVQLTGTIRALDMQTFNSVIERLKLMITGIETSFSVTVTLDFDLHYPTLINDPETHLKLESSLNTIFGKDNVLETKAVLASEDFAFYSRKIPCMFYFLGARADVPAPFFLHHPKMVVNENCISYGVDFFADGALSLLKSSTKRIK
jgi:amidohydrolase